MSSFTDRLIVEKVSARKWKLHTPFSYHVGSEQSEEIITVPKGHETDFASVPRAFWWLFPPDGKWTAAAIIHDYLCDTKGLDGIYSSEEAHKIFLEAMEVLDVPKWKRKTMYLAVKMFGPKWE